MNTLYTLAISQGILKDFSGSLFFPRKNKNADAAEAYRNKQGFFLRFQRVTSILSAKLALQNRTTHDNRIRHMRLYIGGARRPEKFLRNEHLPFGGKE